MSSSVLALMEQAARKAGEALLRDFNRIDGLDIVTKKPGDFVSQADRNSEKIIVETLLAAKPDWGVLGEEGSDIKGKDLSYRWIIDPLDGTTAFLHGIPHWSVTIALEKDGEIIAGLTFDPSLDELFTAEKGQGAFLNGRKIQVSPHQDFKKSLITVNAGYLTFEAQTQDEQAAIWKKCILAGATMRNNIGLALEMAYVAAGRYNLSQCWKAMPWDFAAGKLLVEEAGGIVTDFAGKQITFEKGEILAAHPVFHDTFAKLTGLH